MAVILKTTYGPNQKCVPILYIDSINRDSYMIEMKGALTRFLRDNDPSFNNMVDKKIYFKLLSINNINDINNKKLGYYYIINESEQTLTLYEKTLSIGYIYNSYIVKKIFMLQYTVCSKIVPRVFKKTSLFDNFSQELITKVSEFRDRQSLK